MSGPGTPLSVVAERQLPEVEVWLRRNFARGQQIKRTDLLSAPGQKTRARSTREKMSFCLAAQLSKRRVLTKIRRGTYRYERAL